MGSFLKDKMRERIKEIEKQLQHTRQYDNIEKLDAEKFKLRMQLNKMEKE